MPSRFRVDSAFAYLHRPTGGWFSGVDMRYIAKAEKHTEASATSMGTCMATENMSFIKIEPRGTCLVVTILEQQMRNFEKVTQIKLEILSAVQEFVPKTVVLDLKRVNFVGSVGFLAFLAIRREPSVENVVLCNLDPNVHKLFSISKLILEGSSSSAPLQLADSVEEAITTYEPTGNEGE